MVRYEMFLTRLPTVAPGTLAEALRGQAKELQLRVLERSLREGKLPVVAIAWNERLEPLLLIQEQLAALGGDCRIDDHAGALQRVAATARDHVERSFDRGVDLLTQHSRGANPAALRPRATRRSAPLIPEFGDGRKLRYLLGFLGAFAAALMLYARQADSSASSGLFEELAGTARRSRGHTSAGSVGPKISPQSPQSTNNAGAAAPTRTAAKTRDTADTLPERSSSVLPAPETDTVETTLPLSAIVGQATKQVVRQAASHAWEILATFFGVLASQCLVFGLRHARSDGFARTVARAMAAVPTLAMALAVCGLSLPVVREGARQRELPAGALGAAARALGTKEQKPGPDGAATVAPEKQNGTDTPTPDDGSLDDLDEAAANIAGNVPEPPSRPFAGLLEELRQRKQRSQQPSLASDKSPAPSSSASPRQLPLLLAKSEAVGSRTLPPLVLITPALLRALVRKVARQMAGTAPVLCRMTFAEPLLEAPVVLESSVARNQPRLRTRHAHSDPPGRASTPRAPAHGALSNRAGPTNSRAAGAAAIAGRSLAGTAMLAGTFLSGALGLIGILWLRRRGSASSPAEVTHDSRAQGFRPPRTARNVEANAPRPTTRTNASRKRRAPVKVSAPTASPAGATAAAALVPQPELAVAEPLICPTCGARFPSDVRFCGIDGSPLREASDPST